MRDPCTSRPTLVAAAITACALSAAPARADVRVHGIAGGTLPVGAPQSQEFGAGGGGALAVEVPLVATVGAQAEAGAVGQSKGARPADPTLADHGAGSAVFGTLGVRLRPLGGGGRVGGPWIDANAGVAQTGGAARATFDAHLGHDFRVGDGRFDIGPFVGYTQIVQPAGTLRPEDAHVVWLGVHIALGAPRPPAPPPPVAARNEPPPPPPPPPPPMAEPPKPDRDADGVVDEEDACPDVPGVRSEDPKTNGCPPEGDRVHVEGATIVIDDIIHFDTDSPRVRRVSWPIVKRVADFIVANELEVEIEGHADLVGTAPYNQRLSEARAESVRKLLVHYGVDEAKLRVAGHGFTQPRAPGYTARALQQNRRVEFTITRARRSEGERGAHLDAPAQ